MFARRQKRRLRRRCKRKLYRKFKKDSATAQDPPCQLSTWLGHVRNLKPLGRIGLGMDMKITAWNITILQRGDREEIEDILMSEQN